ncbi:MAG: DUF3857 domain-containing protein [Winogradskyella sp.]|nr:DUF3857 domain-containing protein [Winogradskyella sp.]
MKSIYTALLFLFICSTPVSGQEFYQSYDWEKTPNYDISTLSDKDLVSFKEKIVTEFSFTESSDFVEYYLEHKVFFLNSDDAIESYNKVYLPYDSDSELKVNKARVITANGKILNLDDSKILTATDDETKRTYKYFAFEGIEKGSFIEYMYVVKRSPTYKGKRISFQDEFIKKNVEFDLFAPSNLIYKFKSYNGLKEVEVDTIIQDKNHWFFKIPEISKIEEEPQALFSANRQFIIYALDENTANNAKNITSYGQVAQNVFDYYNAELSKKTQNALKKFIKDLDIDEKSDVETTIKRIENYIKTNIYAVEYSSDKLSDLDTVLKEKVASNTGLVKLYVALFNELDIKFDIVFTCSKEFMRFDQEFEANIFLQDILMYFPKTKKYLAPNENESRYGFPPGYFTDNYGLFIKQVKVGDFVSAVGKISKIKPVNAEETIDKLEIDVNFDNEDLSTINVDFKKYMSGYYGMYIHPFMDIIKPDKKEEIVESYAKSLNENITITNTSIDNEKSELFGSKPLIFNTSFSSEAFMEKAGNKYLFKVGDLIGPQMELYQENERKLPLENEFQRRYERTITIHIPKNYTIANLDDININNEYKEDGKTLLSFVSKYTLDGNLLTITADEFYKLNTIPVEHYEEYRRIINSAADFNKIMLVLAKE